MYLGVFYLGVCQAHHMFEESPLWVLYDWKIQDFDLCNPHDFYRIFHYASFMGVDNPKLAYNFQFYV